MTVIRVAGLDGSKANFGISLLNLDLATSKMAVTDLILIETRKTTNKQVRASSDNLRRAQEIAIILRHALKDCTCAFLEVPYGGQSASAAQAFGTVIGLYASITIPVVEVSPTEAKLASVGSKQATKDQMMEWAITEYPSAQWKTNIRKGVEYYSKKNEHLADSVAIAHAGLQVPSFQQTLAILAANGG